MATKVMYGRREGQVKSAENMESHQNQQIGFAAQGIDPRSVLVVQPKDWKRIQDNLSRYNKEAEEAKLKREERDRLHETSKQIVKNWDNTNEGIREKKLKARKLKEQKQEEERVKLDIEEAKLQAQKRKEALDRAKTLQYYQTDRVKEFHGALLLTEVMKERDAQIEIKKGKQNWEKEREEYLHQLEQRQIEESIKKDHIRAQERFNQRQQTRAFQLSQVRDRLQETLNAKAEDKKEGEKIKEQVEMYEAAKAAILEKKREEKVALMGSYMKDIDQKKRYEQSLIEKDKEEDIEIGKFVDAKKKMIKMRKAKENELFQAFQDHTERMRKKLHEQMKQKVDDEDDRIAKAVAEEDKKKADHEREKEEEKARVLSAIKDHRMKVIQNAVDLRAQERALDEENLKMRIAEDKESQRKEEEKLRSRRERSIQIKDTRIDQMHQRKEKEVKSQKEQLEYDKKNREQVVKDEEEFQEYAHKVISEAKSKGRNPYPLVKAAAAGPGGGVGPKFDGIGGLRPSYPASDGTGVQLPYFRKDAPTYNKTYGHVGKSGKRIGFTW